MIIYMKTQMYEALRLLFNFRHIQIAKIIRKINRYNLSVADAGGKDRLNIRSMYILNVLHVTRG